VDAKHLHEDDGQGLLIEDTYYACGCRRMHRAYHDGSVRSTVLHHNGKVLVDELDAKE
jgi:hypothetical protein